MVARANASLASRASASASARGGGLRFKSTVRLVDESSVREERSAAPWEATVGRVAVEAGRLLWNRTASVMAARMTNPLNLGSMAGPGRFEVLTEARRGLWGGPAWAGPDSSGRAPIMCWNRLLMARAQRGSDSRHLRLQLVGSS